MAAKTKEKKAKVCGVVMPISAHDGCSEQHWIEAREILEDAIRQAGLEPNLVSNADDVGIIQKRIIQNLFSNPIVVCDVSGKNPNVMFELGMRLAFDKPTIIVKDDQTTYSFDTSPIEHLEYPRDLRFSRIVDFKAALKEKVVGTLKKASSDAEYTTFLKHFGKFTVAKLETTEVSKEDFILEELSELRRQMQRMVRRSSSYPGRFLDVEDRIGYKHRLEPDECRLEMRNIIMTVKEMIKLDDRTSPNVIVNAARDLGLLPKCFDSKNKPCIDKIREAHKEIRNELNIAHNKK